VSVCKEIPETLIDMNRLATWVNQKTGEQRLGLLSKKHLGAPWWRKVTLPHLCAIAQAAGRKLNDIPDYPMPKQDKDRAWWEVCEQ
jgi:hypothetical protein